MGSERSSTGGTQVAEAAARGTSGAQIKARAPQRGGYRGPRNQGTGTAGIW